jgi:hypothetical protein
MKTVTGVVLAIFTIVLMFFGFGLRANTGVDVRQPANAFAANSAGVQAVPVSVPVQADQGWQAQPMPAAQPPVLVNCGAGTQTLVRPVWLNGQQVSQVECVPANGMYAGRPVQTVAYEGPVYDAQMAPARTVYQQPAPRRVISRSPQRSWTKTALVIGGTTASGAGIGGLIGGKKGALIGAAIGGGAGTLFEVSKRR